MHHNKDFQLWEVLFITLMKEEIQDNVRLSQLPKELSPRIRDVRRGRSLLSGYLIIHLKYIMYYKNRMIALQMLMKLVYEDLVVINRSLIHLIIPTHLHEKNYHIQN